MLNTPIKIGAFLLKLPKTFGYFFLHLHDRVNKSIKKVIKRKKKHLFFVFPKIKVPRLQIPKSVKRIIVPWGHLHSGPEQALSNHPWFKYDEGEEIKTQKISPTLEKKQIEKLKKFKKSRSSHTVAHALSQIKKGAASKENLIPAILEAVESYATLGEISDAMREVFGTYKENVTL